MSDVIEHGGIIPTIELRGPTSRAVIAPGRGGMLTTLEVGGRSLLYLDETTLRDPKQNVRGGAPVLFPSPGKLAHDLWARNGRLGSMKQHGFARNLPWRVFAKHADTPSVSLELEATDETHAFFPWSFRVELTYTLEARGVRIDQRIENRSNFQMPFGFGFHPYFFVRDADKARARVPTKAVRAFDNTTKLEVDLPAGAIDLTAKEVDLHLIDHGGSTAELVVEGSPTIVVRGSPEYTRWVVWTLAGKDFVCLEPWTCPGNALNSGEGVIDLLSGLTRDLWIVIESP